MFAFGQEEAPAKTEASKRKPHRRVSLAGRSLSSHRNDENMVPVLSSTPSARGHATRRASIVGKGAPIPGQQAFIQVRVEQQARRNVFCNRKEYCPRTELSADLGWAFVFFSQGLQMSRKSLTF